MLRIKQLKREAVIRCLQGEGNTRGMKTGGNVKIGACSWNYHSWNGLVYSTRSSTASGYLVEYAQKYRTVEIDSWFYRIPTKREVSSYKAAVDRQFRFTCKVPQVICLTHERAKGAGWELVRNEGFLSIKKFESFLRAIDELLPQIDSIMFEFEYLNKQKMSSQAEFLDRFGEFLEKCPHGLPLAIETRNGNYLNDAYFDFLREKNIAHVFSEKIYMPHVYDVYDKCRERLRGHPVIRLMGGERTRMEEKTGGEWNRIIEEKGDKDRIIAMILDMANTVRDITLNINNHYEGSAPLSMRYFEERLGELVHAG